MIELVRGLRNVLVKFKKDWNMISSFIVQKTLSLQADLLNMNRWIFKEFIKNKNIGIQ